MTERADQIRFHSVLETAGRIMEARTVTYGDAWRRSGALGAVAKARTKLDRVEAVLRQCEGLQADDAKLSAAFDDLIDGINYQAFATLCMDEQNYYGDTGDTGTPVTQAQWLEDCELLLTAAMYGSPPDGWGPDRQARFSDEFAELEARMRKARSADGV